MNKEITLLVALIVKNEEHCIVNCLNEVIEKEHPDGILIVDTGTDKDKTVKIINEYFENNKHRLKFGKLIEHNFKTCSCHPTSKAKNQNFFDFGLNRSFLLEQCSKFHKEFDYVFIHDADDNFDGILNIKQKIKADKNKYDVYNCIYGNHLNSYLRASLVKNRKKNPFLYISPLHEFIQKEPNDIEGLLKGNYKIISGKTGDRSSNPNKYLNDAQVFEAELKNMTEKDPLYHRYLYYCGQSFRDHGLDDRALEYFYKRIEAGTGWVEEAYVSYKNIIEVMIRKNNKITDLTKKDPNLNEKIKELALKSSNIHKGRSENLYHLIKILHEEGKIEEALDIAKNCYETRKYDVNYLFCDSYIYGLSIPEYILDNIKVNHEILFYTNAILNNPDNAKLIKENKQIKNKLKHKIQIAKENILKENRTLYPCIILVNSLQDYYSLEFKKFLQCMKDNLEICFNKISIKFNDNINLDSVHLIHNFKIVNEISEGKVISYNVINDNCNSAILYVPKSINEIVLNQTPYFKTLINNKETLKKELVSAKYSGVIFGLEFENEDKIPLIFNFSKMDKLDQIGFHSFGENNHNTFLSALKASRAETFLSALEASKAERNETTTSHNKSFFTKNYKIVVTDYFTNNFTLEEKIKIINESKIYYSRLENYSTFSINRDDVEKVDDFHHFLKAENDIKNNLIDPDAYKKLNDILNDKNFVFNEDGQTLSWCKYIKNSYSKLLNPIEYKGSIGFNNFDSDFELLSNEPKYNLNSAKILLTLNKYNKNNINSVLEYLNGYNYDILLFDDIEIDNVNIIDINKTKVKIVKEFNVNIIQDMAKDYDYIFNFNTNYCIINNQYDFIKNSLELLTSSNLSTDLSVDKSVDKDKVKEINQVVISYIDQKLVLPKFKFSFSSFHKEEEKENLNFNDFYYFNHEYIPKSTLELMNIEYDNHRSRGFTWDYPSIIKAKSIIDLPRFFNDDDVYRAKFITSYLDNYVNMNKTENYITPQTTNILYLNEHDVQKDTREHFYKNNIEVKIVYKAKPEEIEGFKFYELKDFFGNDVCLIGNYSDLDTLKTKCLEVGDAFNTLGYIKKDVKVNFSLEKLADLKLSNFKYKDVIGGEFKHGIYIKL